MCVAFNFAEKSLLGHGKDWILGGDKPSLIDLQAVWIFDWLVSVPDLLKDTPMTAENFPKVFAFVTRFRQARGKPKAAKRLNGTEAKSMILAGKEQRHCGFLHNDPLGFKKGDYVSITPTDSGRLNPTLGKLIGKFFFFPIESLFWPLSS